MDGGNVGKACLIFAVSASIASAESRLPVDADSLPQQARLIDGVVVPVPQEIFRVLDTFEDSNWPAILRPDLSNLRPDGSPAKTALSLGFVVGEGFLAITAKDGDEIRDLGRAAIRLARALGVEKSVLRREKSVLDYVDSKDWAGVRKEWSDISADLKGAMIEIKSESLSQLISLGGWLRGLEALSCLVSARYSLSSSQLLNQPEMLDYAAEVIGAFDAKSAADPKITAARDAIIQLRPLMAGNRAAAISEQNVRNIRKISHSLVETLCAE